jgi:hypothetical protein
LFPLMRSLRFGTLLVVAAAACVFAAAPATGAAPRFPFSAGGGFTNPCNGDWTSYSVSGTGTLISSPAMFFVEEHGAGTGTDEVSGETYDVTFDLASMTAQDGSGSFTGHVVVVLVGQVSKTTFVLHAVANVNFRPSEPTIVELQFVTCAGVGRTPY